MAVFASEEQARDVFGELFRILLDDQTFSSKMTEAGLSLELMQTDPSIRLFVDPTGVSSQPRSTTPNIRIKMSCDTAHKLWSGTLLMPVALATGRVRIKGKVAKVLELVPILAPAFAQYGQIASAHGVAA